MNRLLATILWIGTAMVSSSCLLTGSVNQPLPPVSEGSATTVLMIVPPTNLTTYTCAYFSVIVRDSIGTPAPVARTTPVTVSGLGAGSAFASLADCQANQSTSQVYFAPGQSATFFYYRTSQVETLELKARSTGIVSATLSVQTTAFEVLGQTSTTTQNILRKTFIAGNSGYSDGSHFYLADASNNRVLVWNVIPTVSGTPPSFALGQPDLFSNQANNGGLSAASLSAPKSVYGDGTKVYVVDTGNNRVLVWNTTPTTNFAPADFVLGQPNFVSSTANNGGVSATSLWSPNGIFAYGTRLYVSDYNNNRVLVWTALPSVNGAPANIVLGQANFASGNILATNATSIAGPTGIASDGTRLFISHGANRVLGWNTLPVANGQAADFALGQTNLTNSNSGTTATTLFAPSGVTTDGVRLFVNDFFNNRILIWNALPTANGQAANLVLGQSNLNSGFADSGGISASSLSSPNFVFTDGVRLFVGDGNARVLVWNSIPTANKQASSVVLGEPDFISSNALASYDVSPSLIHSPRAVFSDGTRLFVSDGFNHRVLIWNHVPTTNAAPADLVLGQSDFTSSNYNGGGVSGATLFTPGGIFSDGHRLYVADTQNNRVLVWTSMPTASGQSANFALGQPNLSSNTSNNGGLSGTTMSFPQSVFSDGARLWVSDTNNHRILVWNNPPTASGQAADFALGQPSLSSGTGNNGGISASTLNAPTGVYSDGSHLFVADHSNNRVLVWNSLPSANGAAASFALGQPDFVTATFNTGGVSATSLCNLWRVTGDGTKLIVSDQGNNRVLVWNSRPTGFAQAANLVFGQPSFTTAGPNSTGVSANSLSSPTEAFSDGFRMYVADSANDRILVIGFP